MWGAFLGRLAVLPVGDGMAHPSRLPIGCVLPVSGTVVSR